MTSRRGKVWHVVRFPHRTEHVASLSLLDPPRGIMQVSIRRPSSMSDSWDVEIWTREGVPSWRTWAPSERAAKRRALDLVRRLAR